MNHLGTKTIETDRLILRPFTMADAQPMYRNWASSTDVTRYLMWPAHASPEVSAAVLREWTAAYAQPDFYLWAIVLKSNGSEPIGSISVVSHDDRTQKAHIGYCIGSHWWHQGITTEALKAVIAFLFSEVGMQRIESRHDPRNPNSGAVMKKSGMQYEGTLRQSDWNNQGICDASWYAILASDGKR